MQLALVERRALRAAALGLVLRDDLRRYVNQVLLLVILDKVQALRGRGVVSGSFWTEGLGNKCSHLQRGDDIFALNHGVRPNVVD